MRRLLTPLALLPVLGLCGCAAEPVRSPPAPIVPGQTLAEVAAVHEVAMGPPVLALLAGADMIAVFGADEHGRAVEWAINMPRMPKALIFDNGRYSGTLDSTLALAHRGCLLRADGPTLLAARLRDLVEGNPDRAPALQPTESVSPLNCPWETPQEARNPGTSALDAPLTTGEKAAAIAAFVLAPFLAVGDLAVVGTSSVAEGDVLERQRALQLGSGQLEIVHLLGTPSDSYDVTRAGELRILHYRRRAIHDLLIGLRNDRSEWFMAESAVAVLDAWASLGKPAAADDDRN